VRSEGCCYRDIDSVKRMISPSELQQINQVLLDKEPQQILEWATSLFGSDLYQTTAFGLTGLVTVDMLDKLHQPVPLIFIDTLFHFPETLALVDQVRQRYPSHRIYVYRPEGVQTVAAFEALHGLEFWKKDESTYDYVVKVEPARRAYNELNVKAVLTGRRRSQGGKRGDLPIVEIDDTGLIKINPLANWSFDQVQAYVTLNQVPHNELLSKGYRSVGDWHSTQPVKEGEDERAGRWAGREKTECGLHIGYLEQRMAANKALKQQQSKRRLSHNNEEKPSLMNMTPLVSQESQ